MEAFGYLDSADWLQVEYFKKQRVVNYQKEQTMKKIEAAINNAQRCSELVAEQSSLARYIWTFEPEALAEPVVLTESAASGYRLSSITCTDSDSSWIYFFRCRSFWS